MLILTLPLVTMSNRSLDMAIAPSWVAMWVNKVWRVTNSEPLLPKMPGAKGGTGPEALPKLAIKPKGDKQSSDFSQVSLPTES